MSKKKSSKGGKAAGAAVAEAKDAYRAALAPYREACGKAGVACEYEGGRSANVSEKVSFLVEKTDKGVRVMVKNQPKTEEMIPLAALEESINKAAYGCTDKHVGPKGEVGNKGGASRTACAPPSTSNPPYRAWSNAGRAFFRQDRAQLSNQLRAVLA